MILNTRQSDLSMFSEIAGEEDFNTKEDIPFSIALPAFITSELKTAFQIGFLLFLPFLVIDMVVASVLMSLGMMMLSPMLVALPFKILLFVLVDGWSMTVGSLVSTFCFTVEVIMGYENNIEMVSIAFWTVLKLAGPVLLVALIVGLIIGIIQAATSINEMTLSFVPKVVIVILTIAIFTNYLLTGLSDYFMFIFETVASIR